MSRVLEALIARGRRVRRPREQREVAFSLANLSTQQDQHVRLVEKGGIISLLFLLQKSPDPEAQRFAALALGNVASTVGARRGMVDEGVLPPLIKYIEDEGGDMIGRQYCALAVGNIGADFDTHKEIMQLDGARALVVLLQMEDTQCGRYAAFALANLAADGDYRYDVVEENSIPGLIALACTQDVSAQKQALAALRGLAMSPEYRPRLVEEVRATASSCQKWRSPRSSFVLDYVCLYII
jgi:hypothetical protein